MEKENYILTVGLEIHAELKTQTKMFCDSPNNPDETRPNVNICPVCMGHPGTLPTINREAVRQVLRVGVALGGTLARTTQFSRKNYFYPDIPKGYQISQYDRPLVSGGSLNGVAITRVHLEEDTGTLQHSSQGGCSLIDFNRAGVPLMELVTEPVIHSAKEAADFGRELQLLLRYLNASDANMEKGEMRVEANISVAVLGARGTKVEVKNLNSFRAVERAIAYETKRQSALIAQGVPIVQETRGWNDARQETFSQRRKEESHDYRYFPEPDLPRLFVDKIVDFASATLKKELPELPRERRTRYTQSGIGQAYADMFVADTRYGALFDDTVILLKKSYDDSKEIIILAAHYIGSDIAGLAAKYGESKITNMTAKGLCVCLALLASGDISSRGAKDAIANVFQSGGDLAEISKKYIQQSDATELSKIIQTVIHTYPDALADYKKGKESALQFLVGQCMKTTRGAGNPQLLRTLLLKELK